MRSIALSYLALLPAAALAQAPVGNGLRGDYYDGLNFEVLGQSRVDGVLNFTWRGNQPISGVPAENFSVRWTGWLVPPTTGRYVLYLAVDDGARLWLGGHQLLDEWRGQSLSYYRVPVQLQAGRAYPLRLDYCQYARNAHVSLTWELPQSPQVQASWRTLWGLTDEPLVGGDRRQESIPTRYLFSHLPAAPARPSAARPAVVAKSVPAPFKPMRVKLKEVTVRAVAPHPAPPRADALAARLAAGEALTLRALYFEQGRAELPAPVQASLDTLSQALARYPALRLEVQGHTDNQGDPELNRQLSQRRAEAVCAYLAAHGIAPVRLQPLGLGGTQPVADNSIPAERPRNRRVVLRPLP